jgi:sugar phosphate isomerase/epimerase
MNFTRRDFSKLALAAIPASQLLAKPNSKWGGVQVGINAPYSFTRMSGTADKIIEYMTQLNLSACELRLQPVEAYLNAPGVIASPNDGPGGPPPARGAAVAGAARGGSGRAGGGRGRAPLTPEQKAAQEAAAAELTKWRLSLPQEKMKDFRKKYEDAGILIQIVKVDNINSFPDDVLDYFFVTARNLGAHAISTEGEQSQVERLGKFAEKHKMLIGYHGHTNVTSQEAFGSPQSWEKAMAINTWNGINLDIGHFVAGNKTSPIPFIEKYHDHITHIHIKDKKYDDTNVPFGQGDTPIVEVLQLLRKNKWPIQACIEYEYRTPEGSTVLTEIGKCVEYCRKALEA